ncbi:MAG: DUF883 family protein [Rhodobacterales bacterium]
MAQPTSKPTQEDLAVQMQVLRDDVASLTSTISELTRTQARDAASSAKRVIRKTRDGVEHEYEKMHDRAEDALDHADAFVREKPAAAMGIAAGFGLLVGLMMSRRS